MIFKIIQAALFLVFLFVIVGIVWRFFKETRQHSKRMRKLNEWSEFHKQLTDWAGEISDIGIRQVFMNECIDMLINHHTAVYGKNSYKSIDDFDWDAEKMKIYIKWGQYIPSLLQEIRDKKLKQIL
jgi:hypothetical protein